MNYVHDYQIYLSRQKLGSEILMLIHLEPFIVTPSFFQYDWNTVKKDCQFFFPVQNFASAFYIHDKQSWHFKPNVKKMVSLFSTFHSDRKTPF